MAVPFEQFVKQELVRLGFKYSETRKDFVMNCIRGHDHKTQSMGIRKRDGVVHCFGCGESWSWNKFAAEIDAAIIDPNNTDIVFDDPFAILKDQQNEISIRMDGTREPPILEEWYGEWREFDEGFLKSVPTYIWWDNAPVKYGGQCHRAYWKVTVNNELKGYVSRRLDQEKAVKYKNAAGMSSSTVLFPYDFCPMSRCLVLVEGPVDALRLLYHGIPALAVLGTNNWTKETAGLLVAKGVEYPILCGDGDTAGFAFNEHVYYDLVDDFTPSIFPCPNDDDPGGMPVKYVNMLKTVVTSYQNAA